MTHPLRLPSFRLLFFGRTLSAIGDSVIPAALTLAILRITGSTSTLALVLACAMVPRLLLLPLGGVIADRFSPRTVSMIADIVRCVTQLVIAIELFGDTPALSHLAVVSAISGVASAFAMPAASPLVAGTVQGDARLKANSLMGVVSSSAWLIGPALAGFLIFTAGPGWAFALDAASFAASAALLTLVRVDHVPAKGGSLLADLVEGWVEVRSRDWYWSSLIAHATWNGVAAILLTLGPVIAITQLGGEKVWIAVLQAGALGLLAGSLLAGRARLKRPILIANLGLGTYALPLAALAIPAPAPVVIGLYGLAMAALGFLNPVWETVVQAEVPPQALARIHSYDWLLSMAAMPLGYALAPLASSNVTLSIAAIAVAVACLSTAASPGVRRIGLATPATTAQPRPDDKVMQPVSS